MISILTEKGTKMKQDFKQTLDNIIKGYNNDKNFPWRNSPVMSGTKKFDELLKMIRLDLSELSEKVPTIAFEPITYKILRKETK